MINFDFRVKASEFFASWWSEVAWFGYKLTVWSVVWSYKLIVT